MSAASPAIRLRIDSAESLLFAEASADYNPLHVDGVAARRTQFGSTVVHGIHALLKALDAVAAADATLTLPPATLSATFHNPVRTGSTYEVAWSASPGARTRVTASCDGRPAFTLTFSGEFDSPCEESPGDDDPAVERREPTELPFPPGEVAGRVPLLMQRARLRKLFPALTSRGQVGWLADIVATTRIVGMECPGLHSIYSGFRLQQRDTRSAVDSMTYAVDKIDPRFRLARLKVAGRCFDGTLDTFFRPPPVRQASIAEIAAVTRPGAYAGQNALVIGGSRGLGEIIGKVLLAGGASVTLTYARGLADAEAIQREAEAAGLACSIRALDVSQEPDDATQQWLQGSGFTHVYYLASPHIEKNASGHWNRDLFDKFCGVYVHAFARLVQLIGPKAAATGQPVRWMYPSSEFLDTQEPGFAEYCAAKAAGEAVARHLASTLGIHASVPRLPRMRTDQTSGLTDFGQQDPTSIIARAIEDFTR